MKACARHWDPNAEVQQSKQRTSPLPPQHSRRGQGGALGTHWQPGDSKARGSEEGHHDWRKKRSHGAPEHR